MNDLESVLKYDATIRQAAACYRRRHSDSDAFEDLRQTGFLVYLEWRGVVDSLPEEEGRRYLYVAVMRRYLSDAGFFSASDQRKVRCLTFAQEDADLRVAAREQRENRRTPRAEMRRFVLDALSRGRVPSSARTRRIVERTLANESPREIADALDCDMKNVSDALYRFAVKARRLREGENERFYRAY